VTPAPLPPSDPELEDLMSRHLDFVRPDPALRKSSLAGLRGALAAPPVPKPRAPRRAAQPRASFSPLVPVSVASCVLVLALGLGLLWSRTQAPPPPNEPALWARAKGLEEEGMAAYQGFVQGRRTGASASEQRGLRAEAMEKLGAAMEQMNAVLDPKRDEAGILPADYEGYEEDLSRIATYLVDLEKLAPLTPRNKKP